MKRGDSVEVIEFRGRKLSRIVWEDTGPGVLICTEEGYRRAIESGEEPICVGFPASDVKRKPVGRESAIALDMRRRKA